MLPLQQQLFLIMGHTGMEAIHMGAIIHMAVSHTMASSMAASSLVGKYECFPEVLMDAAA